MAPTDASHELNVAPKDFAQGLVGAWLRPLEGICKWRDVEILADYVGCVLAGAFKSDSGTIIIRGHAAKAGTDWLYKRRKAKNPIDDQEVAQAMMSLDVFLENPKPKSDDRGFLAAIYRLCEAYDKKPKAGEDAAAVVHVINFLDLENPSERVSGFREAIFSACKNLLGKLAQKVGSVTLSELTDPTVRQPLEAQSELLYQSWYSRKREVTEISNPLGVCITKENTTGPSHHDPTMSGSTPSTVTKF
ncbi:hypothetical protein QFC21_004997 [Naganishia friedmannii]|uniref:Uncharacterized protein n=1 Tax=Naganishia friedmannii TaxID=89922 RepID=A0ACC2VBR2_9TREE|nr:hypothetical protein QFC21_004997 [Naganishia friedmannii]